MGIPAFVPLAIAKIRIELVDAAGTSTTSLSKALI
jgi:hypothetical protein